MRTLGLTVFLFVAFQGVASASLAHRTDSSGQSHSGSVTATERNAGNRERVYSANAPSKPPQSEIKVLSKDASRSKPVQIYWFFGGR